jgi:hypothetical protein
MSMWRLAGRLIRIACQSLPDPDRAARYQEWTAEAAAILHDPATRSRVRRKVRALLFAADHIRGARRLARQAHMPRTGWRARASAAFPVAAYGVAALSTHWLPTPHPVKLTLAGLLQAAAMLYQILRERRYWLAGSNDEFEKARARRTSSLVLWWVILWIQLTNELALNTLAGVACCAVSAQFLMPFLERRIFARHGSVPDSRT